MTLREVLDWLLDTDIFELFLYFLLVCFCLYLIRAVAYVLLAVAEFFSSVEENLAVRRRKAEWENKQKLLKNMRSKSPELSPEEVTARVEREIAKEAEKNALLFFGLCILALVVLLSADKWVPLFYA